MKKVFSHLAVLLTAISLSVPALASGSAPIRKIDPSSVRPFEITLTGQEITPHSRVDIYSFHLPDGGESYEIPDFSGEYADGTQISVQGTWAPTYARVNVMLKEMDLGSSVYSFIDCNEPAVYGLWDHSEWGCFLKADRDSISGTIRIEVS